MKHWACLNISALLKQKFSAPREFLQSHSTRSEWIEIVFLWIRFEWRPCLTPHGVSGLKFDYHNRHAAVLPSHSTRSEWIEITTAPYYPDMDSVSLHTEWVDWNCQCRDGQTTVISSHSTRSEWIEISSRLCGWYVDKVSLHTEWVDWNIYPEDTSSLELCLTPHGVSGLKF